MVCSATLGNYYSVALGPAPRGRAALGWLVFVALLPRCWPRPAPPSWPLRPTITGGTLFCQAACHVRCQEGCGIHPAAGTASPPHMGVLCSSWVRRRGGEHPFTSSRYHAGVGSRTPGLGMDDGACEEEAVWHDLPAGHTDR